MAVRTANIVAARGMFTICEACIKMVLMFV